MAIAQWLPLILFFRMNKRLQIILPAALALVMVLVFLKTIQNGSAVSSAQGSAPGIILLRLKNGSRDALRGEWAGNIVGSFPQINWFALQVTPDEEASLLTTLNKDPLVAFAEPDYPAQATGTGTGIYPDDPAWDFQWSLNKINTPDAWKIITGTQELTLAILDSGIQLDHPDLSSKIWVNSGEIPGNSLDDDGNGKVDDVHGWHFYHQWTGSVYIPAEDGSVQDDFGHGTHVAGIASASTNNGIGIAGISWGARLMPVKVLDEYGNGWYSDIASGILYAADNGAQIINLSLGGEEDSQLLRDAVDYARARGCLVVASSGNSGGPVFYPAAYEPVLAVAATNENDHHASFSSYGSQVDIAAPGTDIYSTWVRSSYFTLSGTSMAAPHVSGTAALVWSQKPDLTAAEVISSLLETADDIEAPGFDSYTGWGRVNAFKAVARQALLPDIWVSQQAPLSAQAGSVITYTIHYGNQGNLAAENVWISDDLPSGLEPLGITQWDIGSLEASGDSMTITLPVLVLKPGIKLTNQVSVYTSSLDVDLSNNVSQVDTLILYRTLFPLVQNGSK